MNSWFLYTKKGCPYCDKAKKLLFNVGQYYISKEVTEYNKAKIYSEIDHLTKTYRYFPIIFKNGKFLGGFKELEEDIKLV